MSDNTSGNVFVFSFSQEGFEAIVNLTAIDEAFVMAKLAGDNLPQSIDSILSMMAMRSRFNEHRRMEVWLIKLDNSFTEAELWKMADDDPQMVANMARMGKFVAGVNPHKNQNHMIR